MFILVAGITAFAQDSPADKSKKKKDKAEVKIKPYDEVITEKMTSDPGLFLVHRDGDDVYFENPREPRAFYSKQRIKALTVGRARPAILRGVP